MRITKDVRPGGRGCAGDERALRVQAPGTRSGELDEVGDRLRPALLRETDQRDQDLSGGRRIGESTMARLDRGPEELGE